MGTLAYGGLDELCTIDDRVLMHLQVVIIDKLRRGERFPFSFVDAESGALTTLWMAPDIPLRFALRESAPTAVNPAWVLALSRAAEKPSGLSILDEPPNLRPLPNERPLSQRAGVRG